MKNNTAHSIQIQEMLNALRKRTLIRFLSYAIYKRPTKYNKTIPLAVFHLIKKIKKTVRFKPTDTIITRNSFVALAFQDKVKTIILELHENIWMQRYPLKYLKDNVKIITITKALAKDLKLNAKVLPDATNLNSPPPVVMYAGGRGKDKGYHIFLKAAKLSKDFLFVSITDVPHKFVSTFLNFADILVIPNIKSKFNKYTSPLKLFEYMAAKKPIVASNLDSLKEILTTKEAVFFEPNNPNDLIRKINQLAKNKPKMKRIADNAYKKVQQYTWDNRARQMMEMIQ